MEKIVKDPDFPLQQLQIDRLKDASELAQQVKESDLLITDNGEAVAYIVNPAHYRALVDRLHEDNTATIAERFIEGYAREHDGLERLDRAYGAAQRGEWASSDEVESVFGD
jgi:PHD/YefM family antitoxin component YafN of YafNO toxin-antitoxin module